VDLLSGVSHFGAPTPNFQSGKKGG